MKLCPYGKERIVKFYPRKEISNLPNLLNDPAGKPLVTLRSINYLGPYVEIYKIK
jgi:hypothetical protein